MKRALAPLLLSVACASTASAKDLVGVFEDAVKSDPQVHAADANRLASREARPQAWANLLPQLSGSANVTRDHQTSQGTQPFPDPLTGQFVVIPSDTTANSTQKRWGLNLTQTIFSYSYLSQLKAADSTVSEAEATYQAAEQNLISRVSAAYFNVLREQDNLDAQQASLEAIDRQLDQANKRFDVGLIAITDVEEAKAARDTAAAAVIAAKRTLATSVDQLSEITGEKYDALSKPGVSMPLQNPEPASEDKWVETSLDQNPTLVASRFAADVARSNVRQAFGGHLPTLSLAAGRTHTKNDLDEAFNNSPEFQLPSTSNDRQISLQLSVPIFSGGATQSIVRQREYLWIAAKETVKQNSRATERQARDAYLGVISGISRVEALKQALESSQTALKATEAGYEVGTRTAVDVLNARQKLVQSQTDYSGSRYDYIISVIQLRLAAGTLNKADLEQINKWLDVVEGTVPVAPLNPNDTSTPRAPPGTPQPGATTPPGGAPAR
ncbi:MAG TPA: TolC family outer membrane protein [Steroidobacteraceae bacterium]|jgi:outer membrane protein